MDTSNFNPNGPAFGHARITPGDPVSWQRKPDFSDPSPRSLAGDTPIELVDVCNEFVLARTNELHGWLPVSRIIMPPTIVRSYRASNQESAALQFQTDLENWARRGYYPTAQSWAQGSYGCGAFLLALLLCVILIGVLVFIYMLVVKPAGTLTVTFEYRGPQVGTSREAELHSAPAAPRATKRCPECAEDVLADARICRYCRYEFPSNAHAS